MTPVPALPAPKLPADARKRILDAALAEFVARGFDGASTNTIARAAGVAKGLVFHHFGSKSDLFLAVHEHVTAAVTAKIVEETGEPLDLFAWLRDVAIRKLRVLQQDPTAYRFAVVAHDAPPPLRVEIERRMSELRAKAWTHIRSSIDASRLRPGVSLEQAIETLALLGDGLDRRYMPRVAAMPGCGFAHLEQLTEEVWAHYERLRDGLYAPAAPAKLAKSAAPAKPKRPAAPAKSARTTRRTAASAARTARRPRKPRT